MANRHTTLPSRAAIFRTARLWSGLVLFAYVLTHLVNHALGLISLAAMELGREWFLAAWRNPVGTAVLYGSLITHMGLALWSLYECRSLRMPLAEAFRVLLGLAIPLLLTAHIVGTRVAHELFGASDTYARMILSYWELFPNIGLDQSILLVIAWVHGAMGLYWWLRLQPWFPHIASTFTVLIWLIPVLAMLGFVDAGREVSRLAENPEWVASRQLEGPSQSDRVWLKTIREFILAGFFGCLGLVLLGRIGRHLHQRGSSIRVTYPDGREVTVPRGWTVLEASRRAHIPHASVCGGRGRCSTCRVRVVDAGGLPPASKEEQRVLNRVGAPPNVRLACQLRPARDVSIVPLLAANARPSDGLPTPPHMAGREREVVALFADLRGFTEISEHKLPYDLVFLLNRYFLLLGENIERSGGTVIQFTGDGVMALFGVEEGAERGCRQALTATRRVFDGLANLSRSMAGELAAPLRMGIGIHTGPAVVGRMGYGEALYLTAVGDTINVASRLQDLTKEYRCELVISDPVAERARIDVSAFPQHELVVRNRRQPLTVRTIVEVKNLNVPRAGSPAEFEGGSNAPE